MEALGVVIPMFNEEAGAESTVDAVVDVLEGLERETRLVVVDDGSSDGTRAVLERLAKRHDRLVVEAHERNSGSRYGRAPRQLAVSASTGCSSWTATSRTRRGTSRASPS